jgi:uncharacterized protein (TIGR01777 family)
MNNKPIVWIAGGDGLVGNHLQSVIDKSKYDVYTLSRKKPKNSQFIQWDTEKKEIFSDQKPDHIINLAGAGIADARWTDHRKKILVSSRVDSALTLKTYLQEKGISPYTYISASAVGYYGDQKDRILTEESKSGNEFMSDCCIAWEEAATDTGSLCQKTVLLRIGIVLSTRDGALPKMLMTKAAGVFNYFGNGAQYHPWIHIDDLAKMIIFAIESLQVNGIYNAAAPQQITNKEMMQEIMTSLDSNGVLLPAPSFGLRILLGEMAHVVLNSNRVDVQKMLDTGFTFQYTKCGEAVRDLVIEQKY